MAFVTKQPRVGLDEPFTTYLACCRVMAAADGGRAAAIRAQGHALLMDYADHIADETLRLSFLENVAEHQELRQLYAEQVTSQRPARGGAQRLAL
ncbi:MAG: hypothetical protein U0822_03195 [Anaerolineae bacterium]